MKFYADLNFQSELKLNFYLFKDFVDSYFLFANAIILIQSVLEQIFNHHFRYHKNLDRYLANLIFSPIKIYQVKFVLILL